MLLFDEVTTWGPRICHKNKISENHGTSAQEAAARRGAFLAAKELARPTQSPKCADRKAAEGDVDVLLWRPNECYSTLAAPCMPQKLQSNATGSIMTHADCTKHTGFIFEDDPTS